MDFSYTEEQQFIQATARKFADRQLLPKAAELDKTHDHSIIEDHARQLAELGFVGFNVSADLGGSEAGTVAYSLAITEIAKACAATALTLSVTNMVAEVIFRVASKEQQQYYLPRLCSGAIAAASFCLTEASAGSDPTLMRTRAELIQHQEQEYWRLSGTKQWITSATFAGVFVVWAITDPTAQRGKGISCFLVDAQTPGITIAPPQHKLGQSGSPTCDVHFDDVLIPKAALLGKLNDGYRIAVAELTGGRIGIASLALGIGLAAMEYATRYALEREQFGKRIIDFQGLQWQIVDRFTELEAAQLLILKAADSKQKGEHFAKLAAMAKLYASEKANQACHTGLQVLGGYGYMKDFPLERFSRDVRITTIYEGTSEIQRLIIGREIINECTQGQF